MRSAMTIDSGIDTYDDLRALLPKPIRDRIEPDLLVEPPTAGALRVLITIKDPGWHDHIRAMTINWPAMLTWARAKYQTTASVLVRIEIAASLAGYADSQAVLLYAARALDESNYTAVMDALRIARVGVAS